jgi:hypothetical protein
MRPVDQFLSSVREVFARNRTTDWTEVGLLLLGVVLVATALGVWRTRRRARLETSRQVEAVAARSGLQARDLDYLRRIASDSHLSLLDVMTRLPPFERATAAALASKVPPLRPADGSGYEHVRYLRKALGFSPLPAHHWLVSTRELVAGDRVDISGRPGQVVEVNEASFAVELPGATPFDVGVVGTLAIARPDDSRYIARVRTLGVMEIVPDAEKAAPAPANRGPQAGAVRAVDPDPQRQRRYFFAHDERPDRRQDREYVRVRVSGDITLRSVEGLGQGGAPQDSARLEEATDAGRAAPPLSDQALLGTLIDVSAGGLSLKLARDGNGPLVSLGDWKHVKVLCSFHLRDGQHRFERLEAVVATVEALRPAGQGFHLGLAFTSLGDSERDRLSAAVAAEQRAPAPPDTFARLAAAGQDPEKA